MAMAQQPSSEAWLSRIDLFSEVKYVKLVLKIIKDMIHCLDVKVTKRLEFLTRLLVSNSIEDLKGQTKTIIDEYNLFKENITEVIEIANEFIRNTERGLKLNAVISEDDVETTGFSSSQVPITQSFLDGKRLTQNLDILMALVDELQKENCRLKSQNLLLTEEIMEVTESNLGKVKVRAEQIKQKPVSLTLSDAAEISDFQDELPFIRSAKEAIQYSVLRQSAIKCKASIMEPEKSFSHEFFQPCDASFITDESETKILSENDWKSAIRRLKHDQEAMTVAEMKLATIRATAQQHRIESKKQKL